MPSKSKSRPDFMAATVNNTRFATGGAVQGPLTQSRNLLTQTNILPSDIDKSDLRTALPRVYGALAGLAGTPPDQIEGSVMEPGYDARRQGADMTFPIGTALQMLPGLKGLATAMAAEKLVPSGSLAAQRGAITWHGSPHTFDAFDASKIGTGEGAQAYGHGLYLADSPGVAKGYIPKTAHNDTVRRFISELPEDAGFDDVMGLIGKGHFTPEQEGVIKALHANDWLGFDYPSQAISQAYRPNLVKNFDPSEELVNAVNNSGHLYKVDLPDTHIAKMLDWDKPMSDQHPDVQSLLMNHPAIAQDVAERTGIQQRLNDQFPARLTHPVLGPIASRKITSEGTSGQQAYDTLASQLGSRDAASRFLSDRGIPGIKYLDGGSRSAGTGTSNYVVFPEEEKNLTILERNGIPTGNTPAIPDPTVPPDTPGFAKGGSVQDPISARLHHIVFVKPLHEISPEDHDFINSLIQKGRK